MKVIRPRQRLSRCTILAAKTLVSPNLCRATTHQKPAAKVSPAKGVWGTGLGLGKSSNSRIVAVHPCADFIQELSGSGAAEIRFAHFPVQYFRECLQQRRVYRKMACKRRIPRCFRQCFRQVGKIRAHLRNLRGAGVCHSLIRINPATVTTATLPRNTIPWTARIRIISDVISCFVTAKAPRSRLEIHASRSPIPGLCDMAAERNIFFASGPVPPAQSFSDPTVPSRFHRNSCATRENGLCPPCLRLRDSTRAYFGLEFNCSAQNYAAYRRLCFAERLEYACPSFPTFL